MLLFKSPPTVLPIVTCFLRENFAELTGRTSSIKPSRSLNGPKLQFSALCLDLEKYFSVFGKVFFSLKKCLHSLAKTLPRFSNNQKLTQCSGASLIALYKSLFKVGQTISNNLLQTNLPSKNNEGFAQVQPILKA